MAERETAEWSSAWNTGSTVDSVQQPGKSISSSLAAASASSATIKTPQKHLLLSPSSAAAPPSSSSSNSYANASAAAVNSNSNANSITSNNTASSPATSAATASGPPASINENDKVYWLIVELLSPQTREAALLELSKKREQWDDLALVLWHSFGELDLRLPCGFFRDEGADYVIYIYIYWGTLWPNL